MATKAKKPTTQNSASPTRRRRPTEPPADTAPQPTPPPAPVEVDTSGELRVVELAEGWHIVGRGVSLRARDQADAEQALAALAPPVKAPRGPRKPRAVKGLVRDEVAALLAATALPLARKSSDHYGDPRGARLVLPRSASVTRLYLYQMDSASELPGHHTPEQRKEKGLGKVTHVVDAPDMDAVRRCIAAVVAANGLGAPPAPSTPPPRARRKQAKDNTTAGDERVAGTVEATP